MKSLFGAVALMVFLAGSGPALADKYTTFGQSDCGQWLNQRDGNRIAWLFGFLSGQDAIWVVWEVAQKAKNLPVEKYPLEKLHSGQQAVAWMDSYCRANPLKTVADGGIELYMQLMVKR